MGTVADMHNTPSDDTGACTGIGKVSLIVADLDRMQEFYCHVIGLSYLCSQDEKVLLGIKERPGAKEHPLLELVHHPQAQPRPAHTTGLFHFAILVPDRRSLAQTAARISAAGWTLSGAADHLVSEAIYLRDPEGNDIEIYRDRPLEQWPQSEGEIAMDTLPLDLTDLLSGIEGEQNRPLLEATTEIGHVHLQVSDLVAAENFYSRILGLDVTVRSYPGVLFLSFGGYHHHIGLNTWSTLDAPPPPPDSTGLNYFELLLPSEETVKALHQRAYTGGFSNAHGFVEDPFMMRILPRSESSRVSDRCL